MINHLLLVLSLCGLVLGVLACCLLLFSNKTYKHANRLLATALICLVSAMLSTFLFAWEPDIFAYIYRFPSPLLYLLFPATYLYIRTVIQNETRLKKSDVFHFLLPILYFTEMIPYYFTSYEYRRQLVQEVVKHPGNLIYLSEGVLPAYFHVAVLVAQALVYMFLIVTTLRRVKSTSLAGAYIRHSSTFHWIKAFTILIGINSLPLFAFLLVPGSYVSYGTQAVLVVLALSFLVINLYLFFRPSILYGIPQNTRIFIEESVPVIGLVKAEEKKDESFVSADNAVIFQTDTQRRLDISNLEQYKPVLERYMTAKKPFLRQGYTINDLSRDTGIPQHHLSALLNRLYEMRFNEYLNRLRINYISENLSNPEWEKLTLEGIAKQAGFTSRTTFFNTIKKTTGLSPSEFIEQIRLKPPQSS